VRRVLEAATQYPAAFRAIREAHQQAVSAPADHDATPALIDKLETVLVKHAIPMLHDNIGSMVDIKEHMILAIRHQQDSFTQSRQGGLKYIQEVKLAEVIQGVIEEFRPSLQKRGIHVSCDLDPHVIIQTQKGPLLQGITNLVKNAMEAIEQAANRNQGLIQVRLASIGTPGAPRAELRVLDNGTGIRPDVLLRLFSAGFTTKPYGHGLGLHALAHFLAENNGSIRVESAGEHQGAEFIVEIGNA
jgi:signal transduction histidine kinase